MRFAASIPHFGNQMKTPGVIFCSFVSLSIAAGPFVTAQAADPATNADGGTSTLLTGQNIASTPDLKVDHNKTLAIDFSTLGDRGIVLTGDLLNQGTIFAFSTDPGTKIGSFTANNISNLNTGLITSIMPVGGLPGLTLDASKFVSGFSLSFTALNNFLNQGTISSAGNLTISAGNSVTNTATAVASAVKNIDITAVTSLINSGIISSQTGNLNATTALLNNQNGILQSLGQAVNIQGLLNQSLEVHNSLGQILGATVVDVSTIKDNNLGALDVSVLGGVIKAPTINFTSSGGASTIEVMRLDGDVSIKGVATRVGVDSGNLNIVSLDLSGDPVFTAASGNISIPWVGTSDTYSTGGDKLIALAGGDVSISGLPQGFSSYTIDTSGGLGKEIMIGAGVTYSGSDQSGYTITGKSSTGGNISLGSNVGLKTNGGTVTLVANAGTAASGNISVGSIVTTGANGAAGNSSAGSSGGNGGPVSINAAGTLTVGGIDTRGGTGGAGSSGLLGGGGSGGTGGSALTFKYTSNTDKNGKIVDYTYTFSNGSVVTDKDAPKADGTPPDAVQTSVGNAISGSGGGAYGSGSSGNTGNPGSAGSSGGSGGSGGAITLSSSGLLTVGAIVSTGGTGGAGGTGGGGGAGGNGGNGGDSYVAGNAGDGAPGGAGGNGAGGGAGGAGGSGGAVTIQATGGLTVSTTGRGISTGGGDSGTGGAGGFGGAGGSGGRGGTAYGIGRSGSGAYGGQGGNAGAGGAAGSAGSAGAVTISGGAISNPTLGIYADGGAGAAGGKGSYGGAGGVAGSASGGLVGNSGGNGGKGGAGGQGGAGSAGGVAGKIEITAASITETTSSIYTGLYARGGAGGAGGFGGGGGVGASGGSSGGGITAGDGGSAGDGGTGGAGGVGGAGGAGGIIIATTSGTLSLRRFVDVSGGIGAAGGTAGAGANAGGTASGSDSLFVGGTGGSGGAGGSAGAGGDGGAGGKGGNVTLTSGQAFRLDGTILADGGSGGKGGGSGDAGDGSSGSGGGGGVVGGGGGSGGSGGSVAPGGRGGNGGTGGNVVVVAESSNITIAKIAGNNAISTIGGAGGGGGAGGDGGNGGNGASSGLGFAGNTGANGTGTAGSVTVDQAVGFNFQVTGSGGGSGGFGGNGGIGGSAGNGGDIRLVARGGLIDISGDVQSYGNTGGLPGSPGKDGLSGANGASHTYFGLSANLFLQAQGFNALGGLGGTIVIDGVSVGVMVYKDIKSLVTGGGTLPINGINLWVDTGAANQQGYYGYKTVFSTTTVDQAITVGGTTYSSGISLPNGITKYLASNGIIPPEFGQGAFVYGKVTDPVALVPPAPGSLSAIGSGGAAISNFGGVVTNSSYAPAGGNITGIASSSFKVDGTINALGGQVLHIYRGPSGGLQADAHLGPGGSLLLQAPTVEITGGTNGPPASAPTIAAGSVTFITQKNNVSFLIKPVIFGQLTFANDFGLNIGNGKGTVFATSPIKIIQNKSGSVDLANIGGTNLFTGAYQGQDLVVLATGDIVAGSGTPVGATLSPVTSDSRPSGQLIMAAGDMAATATYGTGKDDATWIVLGAGTQTGGNISLSGLPLGSSSTQLVYLQAHAGTDRAGTITTGTVTAATGSNGAAEGSVYAFAQGDIMTGALTAFSANLNSSGGNIGYPGQRLQLNVQDLSTKTTALVFINNTASKLNLRSSYANALYLKTSGDLTTSGVITGGAIVLESGGGISVRNSITAIGDEGEIQLSSANSITDGVGLSYLSAPHIGLTSTKNNVSIGSFVTSKSLTLYAAASTSKLTATSLSSPLMALLAGSGGVSVNSVTTGELVINTLGEANVVTNGAVILGTNSYLPNHATKFNLTAGGNITVNGPIGASTSVLLQTASGTNGSIILNKNIGPTNSSAFPDVTLKADGSGTITQNYGLIDAKSLVLQSGSGDIGADSAPIYSVADSISFTTSGKVHLFNTNAAQSLSLGSWSGSNLTVAQVGDIVVTGSLVATGSIRLYAISGGAIDLQNSMSANTQVRLFASANSDASAGKVSTGSIVETAGKQITTGELLLTSGSGGIAGSTGAFGTNTPKISLINAAGAANISNTGNLQINSTGTSNLTLVNVGTVQIDGISASGDLSVSANKSISTTAKVSAANVTLTGTANNAAITLGADLVATAVTGVTRLSANGNGAISQTTGSISSATLNLSSGSGDLGSGSSRLQTNATTLTFASSGNVYIYNSNSKGALSLGAWSGTSLDFIENGNLTVNGNLAATGALQLTSGKSGFITVATGVSFSGDTIGLTTPVLNNNGAITAAHNLNIGGSVAGNSNANALSVVLATGATLSSTSGNIEFNSQAKPGQIAVSGAGTVSAKNGAGALRFFADANGTSVDITELKGLISVSGGSAFFKTTNGDLIFASNIDTSSATASGGLISLQANGGAISALNLISGGSGGGIQTSAGSIYVYGKQAVTAGNLQAVGSNGAKGANITVLTGGALSVQNVDSSGTFAGVVDLKSNQSTLQTGTISADGAGTSNSAATITLNAAQSVVTTIVSAKGTNGAGGAAITINAASANTGSITTDGDGFGNAAGAVKITAAGGITTGDISACGTNQASGAAITLAADSAVGAGALTSSGAAGGAIDVRSTASTVLTGGIDSQGHGAGNSAGGVYLRGQQGVTAGNVTAAGNSGADGAFVTLSSSGKILSGNITTYGAIGGAVDVQSTAATVVLGNLSTSGDGAGNKAGSVLIKTPSSITTGAIAANGSNDAHGNDITLITTDVLAVKSISASAAGNGLGAHVTITSTAAAVLTVGAAGSNAVEGPITANGVDGGRIDISSGGGLSVAATGLIQANGSTGSGGKILIAMSPVGSGKLTVDNQGTIEATNIASDSGFIGLHSGAGNDAAITGGGTLMAGDTVSLGNLNTTTLALDPVAAGNGDFAQGTVLNNFVFNVHLQQMSLVSSGNLKLPKNLNLTNATGSGAIFNAQAKGDISFQNLVSNGSGAGAQGGAITLTAGGNVTGSLLTSNGTGGASGGLITVKTPANVQITTITATSIGGNGGVVDIDPMSINLDTVNVSSTGGAGGTISLYSNYNITANQLFADGSAGGNITATSASVSINLMSASGSSGGGAISLNGFNIGLGSAFATGAFGPGGLFKAQAGNLYANNIIVSGQTGGNALINAGGGTFVNLISATGASRGGTVGITSGGTISVNFIDVSAGGSAGSVFLNSGSGIYVGSILGIGGSGYGGTLIASAPIFSSSGFIDLYGADGLDGFYLINAGRIFLANPIRTSRNPRFNLRNNGFLIQLPNTDIANQTGGRAPTDLTPVNKTSPEKAIQELQKYNTHPLQGHVHKDHKQKDKQAGARFAYNRIDSDIIDRLIREGVIVTNGQDDSSLNLDKGNLLVCSPRDLTIRTHEGDVHIGAGSIVYVMETGNDVAVFDLYDGGLGSGVFVSAAGQKIKLTPGSELVLTRVADASFDGVNPGTRVAARNVEAIPLSDGITAFQADFSILSAMQEFKEVADSLSCRDTQSKRLAGKLLKTAAAISLVTNHRGAYQHSRTSQMAGRGTPR